MATPPPNPSEGEEGVSSELAEEPSGERPAAAQKMFIAPPASQLPTKLQFVARGAPGPSGGIKQCFRTVKTARRVPTLPRAPSLPEPGPAEPERRARRDRDRHKRHACSTCDKRFSSPGKLQQHVLSHTGELPFSCNLCDKKFNSKFKLVRHNLIHSEARAFKCGTCGKTFNRKDHLTNHERVHNPAKKLYTCERPDCRKSYTSSLSYRKHAALHSAEEGNLQCKICDEVFATRQEIIYHLKVHTGSRTVKNETDKKFTCDHCDRRFFTAKDVRRHLVVHTGRRDFICPHCPQKFGRKDHLVRHMKNAHPEESVKAAMPGTSSDPPPEPSSFEETYSEFEIEGTEFIWKPTSPKEGTTERQTRVPSTDIIVEIPPDLDIKVEPSEVKIEDTLDTHIKIEQPASPGCELLPVAGDFPVMFMVSTPFTQTPAELSYITTQPIPDPISQAHLLDPQTLLIDPGEGPSGLSNEMLELLEESEPEYAGEESRAAPQQRLPAFRKAFQTAKSPKPPPPPPPH